MQIIRKVYMNMSYIGLILSLYCIKFKVKRLYSLTIYRYGERSNTWNDYKEIVTRQRKTTLVLSRNLRSSVKSVSFQLLFSLNWTLLCVNVMLPDLLEPQNDTTFFDQREHKVVWVSKFTISFYVINLYFLLLCYIYLSL